MWEKGLTHSFTSPRMQEFPTGLYPPRSELKHSFTSPRIQEFPTGLYPPRSELASLFLKGKRLKSKK